jgi:hypothetical protein
VLLKEADLGTVANRHRVLPSAFVDPAAPLDLLALRRANRAHGPALTRRLDRNHVAVPAVSARVNDETADQNYRHQSDDRCGDPDPSGPTLSCHLGQSRYGG